VEASVIHHRVDLVLRLLDTTTGYEVSERDVHFYEDEKEVFPIARGSGNYVFINAGRSDRSVRVKVFGYETAMARICYEDMDHGLPMKEVFLIPSENTAGGRPLLSFSGRLPGITAIEAVSLKESGLFIKEFDEKRCIMKFFRTQGINLGNLYYGVIHRQRQTYEGFEVTEEMPDSSVRIRKPLKEEFSVNSPVNRIIFGMVTEEGDYCLRVRDDSDELTFLVRYVVENEVRYKAVDFHNTEEDCLK